MPSPARRRGIGGSLIVPAVVTATLLLFSAPANAGPAATAGHTTTAAATAGAPVPLTELGADAYANATSQHGTQAGPDTFQSGTTIVVAQQAGRFFDGGASGIAFATSPDNGATWTKGVLPGITGFGGGPYQRVSDPSVAYDARHGVWLVSSLAMNGTGGAAVLTSRSTDGGLTWEAPVTTAVAGAGDLDKSWIACDNTPASPYYGRCHTAFDDSGAGNAIRMARSSDGGLTWTVTGTSATGLGGQPVVRPDGTVVVPYLSDDGEIRSFRSRDGGATWSDPVLVAVVQRHTVAGGLRAAPLPSAETDAAGNVYVVWHDCRFQYACAANDIVLSTSATGAAWDDVLRVTGGDGDHFIPGLGVDRASSGATARLALTYYRYPEAACTAATCRLTVAFLSSTNGGASWSEPRELHGPMAPDWLADTTRGRMVGDYISTSVVPGGNAFPAFAAAAAPTGGAFAMRTYTVTGGLPITDGGTAPLSVRAPVANGEPARDLPLTAR